MTNTEKIVDNVFQAIMSDIGKHYKVSDNLSDILSDSLSSRLTTSITQTLAEERERGVEVFAEYIYNKMPHNEVGTKPSWVIRGNSLKQEEARALVIKLLSSLKEKDM